MAFARSASWLPGRMTTGWRRPSSSRRTNAVVSAVGRVWSERAAASRRAQPIELASNERDGLVGGAVVIEEVAGEQHQIDLVGQGSIDDAPEELPAALVVRRLLGRTAAVAVEGDGGGGKDGGGGSRGGHHPAHC